MRPLERTEEILIATVVFGVITLSAGMIFNIVGCIRRGDWGKALFSNTGSAGLLFYWSLIGLGAAVLMPAPPVSLDVGLPLTVISSLCIALAGLLEPWVERHGVDREAIGMTIMEGFFELFESIISLMSNTLSYVRMGAFAVAHGALSLVVFILAELVSPDHGLGYWVVVVLGNLFVIGFEGMIVAIQTLRLDGREALLNKVFDLAAQRLDALHEVEDYGSIVQYLLRDALAHLENVKTLVVVADSVARDCLDAEILAEIGRESGIQLTLGETLGDGTGLVVRSEDGRLSYDNTFPARLERMRSSLCASVFQILRGGDL